MSEHDTPLDETPEPAQDAAVTDATTSATSAPRRRFFSGRTAVAVAAVVGLGLGAGGYALADALTGGDHDRDRGRMEQMGDHGPKDEGHGPMGDDHVGR